MYDRVHSFGLIMFKYLFTIAEPDISTLHEEDINTLNTESVLTDEYAGTNWVTFVTDSIVTPFKNNTWIRECWLKNNWFTTRWKHDCNEYPSFDKIWLDLYWLINRAQSARKYYYFVASNRDSTLTVWALSDFRWICPTLYAYTDQMVSTLVDKFKLSPVCECSLRKKGTKSLHRDRKDDSYFILICNYHL